MRNTSSPNVLTDRIANANFHDVGEYSHKIVTKLMPANDDVMLAAIGVLFILLSERFDIPARRLFEYCENMVKRESDKHPVLIYGLRDYLREEFK